MRKLLTFLACFATAAVCYAQEIPKGAYCAEPRLDGTNVDSISVAWGDDRSRLMAEFGPNGAVTNMFFWGATDMDSHVGYPADGDNGFASKNLASWIAFAKDVRAKFRVLDEDTYVETAPYEYLGQSFGLHHSELSREGAALIFRKAGRLLSVPLDEWKGRIPVASTEVYLGRTSVENYFFSVNRAGNKYFVDMATAKALASKQPDGTVEVGPVTVLPLDRIRNAADELTVPERLSLPDQSLNLCPFLFNKVGMLWESGTNNLVALYDIAPFLSRVQVSPIRIKEGFLSRREDSWLITKNKGVIDVIPYTEYFVALK